MKKNIEINRFIDRNTLGSSLDLKKRLLEE
jgi:hypothetical protein